MTIPTARSVSTAAYAHHHIPVACCLRECPDGRTVDAATQWCQRSHSSCPRFARLKADPVQMTPLSSLNGTRTVAALGLGGVGGATGRMDAATVAKRSRCAQWVRGRPSHWAARGAQVASDGKRESSEHRIVALYYLYSRRVHLFTGGTRERAYYSHI